VVALIFLRERLASKADSLNLHSASKCALVGHFLLYTHCLLRILQPLCAISEHTGSSDRTRLIRC
jgi:hypothetical protein